MTGDSDQGPKALEGNPRKRTPDRSRKATDLSCYGCACFLRVGFDLRHGSPISWNQVARTPPTFGRTQPKCAVGALGEGAGWGEDRGQGVGTGSLRGTLHFTCPLLHWLPRAASLLIFSSPLEIGASTSLGIISRRPQGMLCPSDKSSCSSVVLGKESSGPGMRDDVGWGNQRTMRCSLLASRLTLSVHVPFKKDLPLAPLFLQYASVIVRITANATRRSRLYTLLGTMLSPASPNHKPLMEIGPASLQ